MKIRDLVAGIIFLTFMIWFLASWTEVQIAAVDNWQHTYCPLNMFVLLCEVVK